jgi:hypothetical protein
VKIYILNIYKYLLYIFTSIFFLLINYFYSKFFIIIIDLLNILFNYFNQIFILIGNLFNVANHNVINTPDLNQYIIYYRRRKIFKTKKYIHILNKIFFKDEKFFIYSSFFSKEFLYKSLFKFDLV